MKVKKKSPHNRNIEMENQQPEIQSIENISRTCRKCSGSMFRISRTTTDRIGNMITFGLQFNSRFECMNCGNQQFYSSED